MDLGLQLFFGYTRPPVGELDTEIRLLTPMSRCNQKSLGLHVHFNFLIVVYLSGLKSKNSRQRAGVLEQETKLILENGIEVCQPSPKKAFELVASFIGDKDNSVR